MWGHCMADCGQASILNATCHEIIYEADVKTVVKNI